MLYSLVEMNRVAMAPMRIAAKAGRAAMKFPGNPVTKTDMGRSLLAAMDVFESSTRFYGKPEWRIDEVEIDGEVLPVTPSAVWRSPWCELLHFKVETQTYRPRMLIAAPLSGHYATLLRGTVQAFLPSHDVYITDWVDARMVPVWAGRFDLDDYIDHIRGMLTHLGPNTHILGVCQPGPPVLAAVALMAEDKDPNRPLSMTFMGSPIDARKSPTIPNQLSEERPFEWFESTMIHTVPAPYPGMMRRVYPGFVQLASFMNMNWNRHVDAQYRFFDHLVAGDGDGAKKHREFYDEYLSVLDLTEEFYLQTITKVFQEHHLARGIFKHRGRLVKPEAIRDVALMTVEGEKDDISGIGQTQAAHDLCASLPNKMKRDYIQPEVGHYGVFNGRRFEEGIVPRVTEFIAAFNTP